MTFAAVILAGGMSRRMGEDKSQLKIGDRSFIEILCDELSGFDELYLSVAKPRESTLKLPQLSDSFPEAGPLSGLCAGLEGCVSDAALFVPCDTPFFTAAAGRALCAALEDDYDGVIAVSSSGISFPLCAVYRKSAAALFRRALENGHRRVLDALSQLRIKQLELPDAVLKNINTPADYEAVLRETKKNILLTGERGIGKSALIKKEFS